MSCVLPWYNCTGWLGVKHQLTYLLTSLSSAQCRWRQSHMLSARLLQEVSVWPYMPSLILTRLINLRQKYPFIACFFNIHRSGMLTALFGSYTAGATWNCCHLGHTTIVLVTFWTWVQHSSHELLSEHLYRHIIAVLSTAWFTLWY